MSPTGRLSNREPEMQVLRGQALGKSTDSTEPLIIAGTDYSEMEKRVLAHIATSVGVPYEEVVSHYENVRATPTPADEFNQTEDTVKSVLIAGASAAAAMAASMTMPPRVVARDNRSMGEGMEMADAVREGLEETLTIPDRVNIDAASPYFWSHFKLLGVKIDGEDRPGDVHEFCVSEGWAMVRKRGPNGKFAIDPENSQRFALERVQGKIEPYFRQKPVPQRRTNADFERLAAAAEKRARKAAKLKGQSHG